MNLLKPEQAKATAALTCSSTEQHLQPEKEAAPLKDKYFILHSYRKAVIPELPLSVQVRAHCGVSVRSSYTNDFAGKTFTNYATQSQ